ncbi:hypothetical protein FNV43_RR01963 [Rhamnella rubrinervis]|uniref:Uncharacterized protein n=1 Tax=Rhamnella rubrinervis TaxID=2594499 RepID=A0A8K0HQL4_9ROSA|nr:hypothetical protein FNV43_RR01963 [Rhamnella rubrinervis]
MKFFEMPRGSCRTAVGSCRIAVVARTAEVLPGGPASCPGQRKLWDYQKLTEVAGSCPVARKLPDYRRKLSEVEEVVRSCRGSCPKGRGSCLVVEKSWDGQVVGRRVEEVVRARVGGFLKGRRKLEAMEVVGPRRSCRGQGKFLKVVGSCEVEEVVRGSEVLERSEKLSEAMGVIGRRKLSGRRGNCRSYELSGGRGLSGVGKLWDRQEVEVVVGSWPGVVRKLSSMKFFQSRSRAVGGSGGQGRKLWEAVGGSQVGKLPRVGYGGREEVVGPGRKLSEVANCREVGSRGTTVGSGLRREVVGAAVGSRGQKLSGGRGKLPGGCRKFLKVRRKLSEGRRKFLKGCRKKFLKGRRKRAGGRKLPPGRRKFLKSRRKLSEGRRKLSEDSRMFLKGRRKLSEGRR